MQYLHVGSACHLPAGARYAGRDDQGIDRSGWLPDYLSCLGPPPRHPSLQGEPIPANETQVRVGDYSATDRESAVSVSMRHRSWPHDACESVEKYAQTLPSTPTPMRGTWRQAFHGHNLLNLGKYPETNKPMQNHRILTSTHLPPPATRGRHPPPVSATLPLMCSQPPTANRHHPPFAPLHRPKADLHFCT